MSSSDIIIVKAGIEPSIWYSHICTLCTAQLEVPKSSPASFLCPHCKNSETVVQDSSTEIKKYGEKYGVPHHRPISQRILKKK